MTLNNDDAITILLGARRYQNAQCNWLAVNQLNKAIRAIQRAEIRRGSFSDLCIADLDTAPIK